MTFFESILSFVVFIIIIGILVFVHELGHFLAAKLSGVTVEEFALGFGPRLFSRQFKGTVYRINLLPLGGYVKLLGERGESEEAKSPYSYAHKPYRSKIFILAAGVVMNVLFACILFMAYLPAVNYQVSLRKEGNFNFVGAKEVSEIPPSLFVLEVEPGSPAASVLASGDALVSLNGESVQSDEHFTTFLAEHAGQEITLGIVSSEDYKSREAKVTLRQANDEGQALLGVGGGYNPYTFYVVSYFENVLSGFTHAYNMFFYQIAALGSLITQAVAKSDITIVSNEVAGLVVVNDVVGSLISVRDFLSLLNLTAVVSLSLAFANFLPIPLLDGGQALIETIEKIRRKQIGNATIERINLVSLMFILALFVLITLKDIIQVDLLGNIISGIQGALGR
jgi:regulator of sigma E protease